MPIALVTGFGPFPGVAENASGTLATVVDGARLGRWQVVGRVVDTSWHRAWPALEAAVRAVGPDALVMFGVAPRSQVEIECIARNRADARPDCDGALPPAAALGEGPELLATTLPRDLDGCQLSEDAGAYLCNALFYQAQNRLPEIPHRGFVHIPHAGLWLGLRFLGRLLRRLDSGAQG